MSEEKRTAEKKTAARNGVRRMVLVGISLLLEMVFLVVVFSRLSAYAEWISMTVRVLALIVILTIYCQNKTPSVKMPWIILTLTFPVLGLILYVLIGVDRSTRKMRRRYRQIDEKLLPLLHQDETVFQELEQADKRVANISRYIVRYSGYPVYRNTDVVYHDQAPAALERLLEELEKAEQFIFMEYHAIEDGEVFHRVEEILRRKVEQGVEVRLFYDDMGSIWFISTDFARRMRSHGIKCRVFNPFAPGLNLFLNNRDHRKITVIDGKVAFTGGYNLANEYFGLTHPYGHWKDTGVMLTGDAVRSLTVTFLEMWNAAKDNDLDDLYYEQYLPFVPYTAEGRGFVQPYADNPIDQEHVGEEVYMSIAERATDYLYFMTPYLIITDEMIHTLSLAAKRGVDVRIVTPGIPDKKITYTVTRSYYNSLARNGVRIFEYTPGFCHGKMCVCDDDLATCGTINLDFRSLYHHFENGCLFYDCQTVGEIRADFDRVFPQCREVTEKYRSGLTVPMRVAQLLLRIVSPLL